MPVWGRGTETGGHHCPRVRRRDHCRSPIPNPVSLFAPMASTIPRDSQIEPKGFVLQLFPCRGPEDGWEGVV